MSDRRVLDQRLSGAAVCITACMTDFAITGEFTPSDTSFILVALNTTTISACDMIPIQIQSSPDGGTTWIDSLACAVCISATGVINIPLDAVNVACDKFLWPLVRVVATTGACESATFTNVYVMSD